MTRILGRLAVFNMLLLVVVFAVGWLSFAHHSYERAGDDTYTWHFGLALFAILSTLAVHCLIFIYFLGTGRWVKEVALAYEIPDAPLPKLTRELKRRTFPPALFAMLIAIATAAAGAGRATQGPQAWPWFIHASLALATIVINAWAYVVEYRSVRINAGVLDEVLCEVDRIRAERGLPSNAEALRREAEGLPSDAGPLSPVRHDGRAGGIAEPPGNG
jgi:hypothetical protein